MQHDDVKTAQEVLSFWFESGLKREQWFTKDEALDRQIATRFAATHLSLARRELEAWRATPESRLAAIIVLDQFSRNIYRDTALAFAADWLALSEAKHALDAGADKAVATERRAFFYYPFEHSEDIADQKRSVALFTDLGDSEYLDYAERHLDVIVRFGRFPHRNAALGRVSTPAEQEYLAQPGAGF